MAIGIVPTDYMTIILDDYFGLFWMLTQRFAGAPLQVGPTYRPPLRTAG